MSTATNYYNVLQSILNDDKLVSSIKTSKILIVGSGGIGVEIIKNVVLLGFTDLTLIDLDTIEISNLNRQFLFNKNHVGKSKSLVAANVSQANFAFHSNLKITALHNSIMSSEYDVDFFKTFKVVINALDNRAARSHVNRMCLAANVPLVESGSEGYMGQVTLIKRDVSACYECDGPRQEQKTFASCTIRNTPSLPIHCIVWGKHLFAQLFGEEDADNDVSPDMNDPELGMTNKSDDSSDKKPSTREWANSNSYDSKLLFDKLFKIDIEYLLKMSKLWENRRRPTPLTVDMLSKDDSNPKPSSSSNAVNGDVSANGQSLKDQRIWSLSECYEKFCESINILKKRLGSEGYLVWDKDDDEALDFVTSVANLRSHCFGIEKKSRFDVKSMAGNIIPAISSTNSIVGGLITLQLIHLLRKLNEVKDATDQKEVDQKCKEACKCIYLRKVGLNARNLISSYDLFEPNPNCLVCNTGRIPEIELTCNLSETTMNDFVEQIIMKIFNFVCPDIQIEGQPTIIWSSEDADESEKAESKKKQLNKYPQVHHKQRLRVYDLLQNQSLIINLLDGKVDKSENEERFYIMKIINEGSAKNGTEEKDEENEKDNNFMEVENGNSGIEIICDNGDDCDVFIVDSNSKEKRKLDFDAEEILEVPGVSKKLKI